MNCSYGIWYLQFFNRVSYRGVGIRDFLPKVQFLPSDKFIFEGYTKGRNGPSLFNKYNI